MRDVAHIRHPAEAIVNWRAVVGCAGRKGLLQRDLWDAGDGGLFSTLDDLFLWDRALNIERLDRSLNLRYRRNRRCASRQPERLSGAILFVSLTLGSLAARAADRTRTGHDGGACTLRPLAARMLATCRLAAPPIAV